MYFNYFPNSSYTIDSGFEFFGHADSSIIIKPGFHAKRGSEVRLTSGNR